MLIFVLTIVSIILPEEGFRAQFFMESTKKAGLLLNSQVYMNK